jgi:hypothetical protein
MGSIQRAGVNGLLLSNVYKRHRASHCGRQCTVPFFDSALLHHDGLVLNQRRCYALAVKLISGGFSLCVDSATLRHSFCLCHRFLCLGLGSSNFILALLRLLSCLCFRIDGLGHGLRKTQFPYSLSRSVVADNKKSAQQNCYFLFGSWRRGRFWPVYCTKLHEDAPTVSVSC